LRTIERQEGLLSIAELTPPPSSARSGRRGSDYADLLARVRQAGLLDRRRGYYAVRITVNALMLAVGWGAFVLLGDSWWQLGTAAFLAVVFTQTGFIGHDAGHRQIFRSRRANDLAGLLHGNLGIGMAFGWWIDKHHRHHAHPNQEGLDPDITGESIVWTDEQARRRRGLGRFLARHQGYLFFPLLLLEALALHVASVQALFRQGYRHRVREGMLLAAHGAAYFGAVFLVLSPVRALVFVVVQQGLFGVYLGSSFAPNHKGMPILSADDDRDFLRRQVLTSRNVRGGWLVDFVLGGLNYQIEHHLFPSMPRPALRQAQPMIRAYCQQHDLSYEETSLLRSYRQALRYLHDIGRGEGSPAPADSSRDPRVASVDPAPPAGIARRQ
jgi:fatty acid desaturase